MKKWSGGVLILVLAVILLFRYILVESQPKKQSAYDFFNNHPTDVSRLADGGDVKLSLETVKTTANEKAHLIDVQGLGDLYELHNISEDKSRPLLVWAQMRKLLSRSDSLPETAVGVKEAAIAWKELLRLIETDEASTSGNNSSNIPKEIDCPYSTNTSNTPAALSGGNILEIPCGLVEDSSITIIGIPNQQYGSFQVDLVGSKLPEDLKHPIILRYKVYQPKDSLLEEPVIIQNSWVNKTGWGKEEKCPDRKSANSVKVDGLLKCNEQVFRSSVEENVNVSHPRIDKLNNVSSGSGHLSANFPFVEGNPFTATLWVGVEGFHMTVNGRHETSFAYREVRNLEPWLVTGVTVAGGLDLIAAFAKGLPVNEDPDLVDTEHLKAPPISKRRVEVLIGVFSTANNFERRMALRRSWMQYDVVRRGDVAVRFFIGLDKNQQVNFKLWKEAEAFGDIQLMPFVDYYSLLTLKTIAMCIMGIKILPAKYIMKTDDDAFVRIDEIVSSLKEKVPNGLLYGLVSFDSEPQRDKDSKWYISPEEWPHASYPPWAHGPGYLISRDIAKFVVHGHHEWYLKLFKLEDVAMGIWIEQYKRNGKEVHYITDDRFNNVGCESNYILAHYQNPRMVLCLWEKLQKEHEPNCCE